MRNDDSTIATNDSTAASGMAVETAADTTGSYVAVPMTVEASVPHDKKPAAASIELKPALSLSVLPKHEKVGMNSKLTSMPFCASVLARSLTEEEVSKNKREPVDIVVALDVSGSMSGNKLDLCKQTLEMLLSTLISKDRLGLISYDSKALIEFPPMYMTAKNKQIASDKIKSLRTRGQTNISAAIGLAFQEMWNISQPNGIRSIFLLTDGLANMGITNSAGLVEITKNCIDSNPSLDSPPIGMYCFGYGSDHDSSLLVDIAKASGGNGAYYYVEADKDVASAFGDALGGLMSVVAQNTTLTIHVPEEAAVLGVQIDKIHHDSVVKREDGSFTVTVGDFYAEESRDIIVQVKLSTSPSNDANNYLVPHLFVSMAYTDVQNKTPVFKPVSCSIAREIGSTFISPEQQHVEEQCARILALEDLERAMLYAESNDLVNARRYWKMSRGHVERAVEKAPACRKKNAASLLNVDLDRLEEGFASTSAYQSKGRHIGNHANFSACQQRQQATACSADGNAVNSTKKKMLKKFSWSQKQSDK